MSDVGTEETSWSSFGDESGDQEYDDAERVGVTALILILFGVGIVVAGGLFFWVYRNESLKKKERAASSTERELKMNPSNTSDSTNKSVTGSAGGELYRLVTWAFD